MLILCLPLIDTFQNLQVRCGMYSKLAFCPASWSWNLNIFYFTLFLLLLQIVENNSFKTRIIPHKQLSYELFKERLDIETEYWCNLNVAWEVRNNLIDSTEDKYKEILFLISWVVNVLKDWNRKILFSIERLIFIGLHNLDNWKNMKVHILMKLHIRLKVLCVVLMVLIALVGNVLVILSVILNKSMR